MPGRATIAVLTLARHRDGIWISRLVERLRQRLLDAAAAERGGSAERRNGRSAERRHDEYEVEVVCLEDLHGDDAFPLSSPPPSWAGLVNRVSDAASPSEAKAALAALRVAEMWGVPVFNGPRAYSICVNKVLHHHAFARAGLRTPRSVKVQRRSAGRGDERGGGGSRDDLLRAAEALEGAGCRWPFLIKPNSAGFGAGIKSFADKSELEEFAEGADIGDVSEDGVALLQEYVRPVDGCICRAWFLHGRVQCAVRRALLDDPADPESDFAAGCAAGGGCSLARAGKGRRTGGPTTSAWKASDEVAEDVEAVLRVMGKDCHAGSVELLRGEDGARIYFDLNLLSTLPLDDGSVGDGDGVWSPGYDPWLELADGIIAEILA